MMPLLLALALAPVAEPITNQQLTDIIQPICEKEKLPALGAAVVFKGKVIAQAVVGVRKWGDPAKAELNDPFHIGSNTKSMTATIIARFVHDKKMRWDMTPVEVFPELKGKIDPSFKKVTLKHLLSHRAGIVPNFQPKPWPAFQDQIKKPRQTRFDYVSQVLSQPTKTKPGSTFEYSNTGYVIATAMAEKVMNQSWEQLIQTNLFKPLGMKTAGFGPMGTPGTVDAPWQHTWNKEPFPMGNQPTMDNPPIISPAGRVHCSIGDLAKYMTLHLDGENGRAKWLTKEEFKLLHTGQFGGDYGLGWVVIDRDWADHRAVFHNGSNNMNYAVIWMAPSRDFGVCIATNMAGGPSESAVDQVASAVILQLTTSPR